MKVIRAVSAALRRRAALSIAVTAVTLSAAPAQAAAKAPRTPDAALRALDDDRDAAVGDLNAAYDAASALALMFPDRAAVLWRAARAAYDLATSPGVPPARQADLLAEAQRWLVAAKTLPDGRADSAVFRWSGMVLEALGARASTSDYIRSSYVVRDDWMQAIAIDPGDAAAHHLLGRWCLGVADTPGWKRAIAGAIFAESPTVRGRMLSGGAALRRWRQRRRCYRPRAAPWRSPARLRVATS